MVAGQADLERTGWTFDTERLSAHRLDGSTVQLVADEAPLFFLIRAAASVEGDELATQPVTADLVLSVSGEAFMEQSEEMTA